MERSEDEAAWIGACRRGERRAFEPLVRRYGPRAYRFAVGLVRDPEDAKDLSQEAFIRAYHALGRFDTARPFYPWFLTILRNLCWSHLRRRRPTVELREAQEVARTNGSSPELRLALERALAALGDNDREVLLLREIQELSYAEISQVLDIPRGTVMSRLYHARRRLRDAFDGAGGGR